MTAYALNSVSPVSYAGLCKGIHVDRPLIFSSGLCLPLFYQVIILTVEIDGNVCIIVIIVFYKRLSERKRNGEL